MPSNVRAIIMIVLVIGGLAAVGFVLRDRLGASPGGLQVGDCFQVPVGDTVSSIQHLPCTEAHDGEVFVVRNYAGADAYPTVDQLRAWVDAECIAKDFPIYTGSSYDDRDDLTVAFFYPPEDAWANGQRTMICYLNPNGGATVTSSYRSGQPVASPP